MKFELKKKKENAPLTVHSTYCLEIILLEIDVNPMYPGMTQQSQSNTQKHLIHSTKMHFFSLEDWMAEEENTANLS